MHTQKRNLFLLIDCIESSTTALFVEEGNVHGLIQGTHPAGDLPKTSVRKNEHETIDT